MSKSDKKKSKKSKGKKVDVSPTPEQTAHLEHLAKIAAAAKVVASKKSSKKERKAAQAIIDEAEAATKEREVKKAEALEDESITDRDTLADAALKAKIAAKRQAREESIARGETEPDRQWAAKAKSDEAAKETVAKVKGDAELEVVLKKGQAKIDAEPERQVAEVVETEEGTVIAVGHNIAKPAEVHEVERDWMGRPVIYYNGVGKKGPEVKKKGYTRMTTYIGGLEDTSTLEAWKLRKLLEGITLDTTAPGSQEMIPKAADIIHRYDVALKKLAKRERKGELDLGQFALIRDNAAKEQKDALNEIVEEAMELAGIHERAQKGTDLHALTERYDKGELKLDDPSLSVVDRADLTAYAEKMKELGLEHVAQEVFVVNDALQVGGTLDRLTFYKPEGAVRRKRVVADIKTGRIDYSAGKIGMQIFGYASSELIDPDVEDGTGRKPLGADKTLGLLIHLPQGEAKCTVYEVDLKLAAQGFKLATEVRSWRNRGKKTYDLAHPLGTSA